MAQSEPDIKRKILLSAKRLFAIQGYDSTTVRQICEDAGANVALISYYFGGKEGLFYALFDEFFTSAKLLEAKAELLVEPLTGLKTLIEEVLRFRKKEPELVMLLQQEIFKNTQRIDYIRNLAFPVWRKLRSVLEQGRTEGLFRFRSLDNTMLFVMGILLFHKNTDYFKPILEEEPPVFEDLVQDTQQFVLLGLGVKAGE